MKDRTEDARANAKRLAARLNADRPMSYMQGEMIIELLKLLVQQGRDK